jgi:hypothetical protein
MLAGARMIERISLALMAAASALVAAGTIGVILAILFGDASASPFLAAIGILLVLLVLAECVARRTLQKVPA